jgi:hypothetical protein
MPCILQQCAEIPPMIRMAVLEVTQSSYSCIHLQPPLKDVDKPKALVSKEITADL